MLNIKNIFSLMKEKIYSIKTYVLVFLFFLMASMDGYTCDRDGHIKFHNYTHIPITVTVSRTYSDDPKKRKIRLEKKIVRPKTTSGGMCWYSDSHGFLINFKTSFKYKGQIFQGPEGEIDSGNTRGGDSLGRIKKHKGDQRLISSSACKKDYTICTVNLRMKK